MRRKGFESEARLGDPTEKQSSEPGQGSTGDEAIVMRWYLTSGRGREGGGL